MVKSSVRQVVINDKKWSRIQDAMKLRGYKYSSEFLRDAALRYSDEIIKERVEVLKNA